MIDFQQNKLFSIINTLGNNINFNVYNYINKLSFIKIYNVVLILRIRNLISLFKSKKFNIFFYNYIQKYHIGIKNNFKNNLKNNFKFFIYSLYKSNIILFKYIKNFKNLDSLETLNNLLDLNFYYPYSYSNSNLSSSFFYNFLYKDLFKFNNFNLINKCYNYNYLRSNKKKRFKQKESEKLSILRKNLNLVKEDPYRLKFYYRYFEYKRLHSYWNKEAFLEKKFKYFNPKKNKNIFLLHFFYKFRKFKIFYNKYDLFRKKIFINFWLQARIKKFQFSSYKFQNQKKKTRLKFTQLYFNSIISQSSISQQKNLYFSLLSKYKKYFFSKKLKYNSFLITSNINNYLLDNIFKNNDLKIIKTNFFKFFYSYNNIRNSKLNKNFHLLYPFKFIKKINKSNIIVLFDSFKKNKFFRIKFKYLKWLNQQKIFKNWKFNKYLSYRRVSFKNFKKNLNTFNLFYNIKRNKNNKNYLISKNLIYKAQLNTYTWIKNDFYLSNLNNVSLILNNLKQSSNNYYKNFSFYKSNKILDQKYTYLNLFKNNKLNTGIFKNKSKNNFILQKLSKNLFKKSWVLIYKQFQKSKKYKGFYNLVPIYNYFFINKVIKLYKRLFSYSIISSYKTLFNGSLKKHIFYPNFLSSDYKNRLGLIINPIKLNLLNRIYNIRLIDKKYSFKKRKERQLLYSLKNYKNIQSLLLSQFKKTFKSPVTYSNNIYKHKEKLNLFNVQKIIKKLKFSLNILLDSNFKQDFLLTNSLKNNSFKKNSFLNFLKYYNTKYNNKSIYNLNFFDKNNLLHTSIILKDYFFLKKKNINIMRSKLLKVNKIPSFLLNKKNKKNLFIIDTLFINKIKKNNIIKFNWGLNFLLKKNYFTFLRLFKFFSLYKGLNKNINLLGFGRLSNYLNINNQNIFSIFNFYIYNFLNFSLEKNLFLELEQNYNYLSTYQNLKYSIRTNSFIFKKSVLNNTSSKVISLKYNYDILNKGNILSKVIYSKHFILKYWSLLNINKLLKFRTSNFLNKLSAPHISKLLFINYYMEKNTYIYYNNIGISVKKIYYNIIDNYKNILFF